MGEIVKNQEKGADRAGKQKDNKRNREARGKGRISTAIESHETISGRHK
jgi:hypothetical protein